MTTPSSPPVEAGTAIFGAAGAAFGYHGQAVVRDVSLTVGAGERVAIVGPNGAGKSTLIRGLLGLVPTLSGSCTLLGRPLAAWSRSDVARRVAYLPQDVRPPAHLAAIDVVLLGRAVQRTTGAAAWAFDSAHDIAAAHEALAQVGAEALASRPFVELSGGERRRVLLAMAWVQASVALVLDEPTAGLDVRATSELVARLLGGPSRGDAGLVLVTHDLGLVGQVADRVIVVGGGPPSTVVADGPVADVLTPDVLGPVFGVDLGVARPEGARGPILFAREAP